MIADCPHCRHGFYITSDMVGKVVTCSRCNKQVRAPDRRGGISADNPPDDGIPVAIVAETKAELEERLKVATEEKHELAEKLKAEIQVKAELEEKLKTQPESNAKDEEQLRAELEHRIRNETDEKIGAYAKTLAETEEKLKTETEAKAELEEKLQTETEARSRAEQLAQMQVREKDEFEENLKTETEARITAEQHLKSFHDEYSYPICAPYEAEASYAKQEQGDGQINGPVHKRQGDECVEMSAEEVATSGCEDSAYYSAQGREYPGQTF